MVQRLVGAKHPSAKGSSPAQSPHSTLCLLNEDPGLAKAVKAALLTRYWCSHYLNAKLESDNATAAISTSGDAKHILWRRSESGGS